MSKLKQWNSNIAPSGAWEVVGDLSLTTEQNFMTTAEKDKLEVLYQYDDSMAVSALQPSLDLKWDKSASGGYYTKGETDNLFNIAVTGEVKSVNNVFPLEGGAVTLTAADVSAIDTPRRLTKYIVPNMLDVNDVYTCVMSDYGVSLSSRIVYNPNFKINLSVIANEAPYGEVLIVDNSYSGQPLTFIDENYMIQSINGRLLTPPVTAWTTPNPDFERNFYLVGTANGWNIDFAEVPSASGTTETVDGDVQTAIDTLRLSKAPTGDYAYSSDLLNYLPINNPTVSGTLLSDSISATSVSGSFVGNLTGLATSATYAVSADLLDGQHGSYYAPSASPTFSGTTTLPDTAVTSGGHVYFTNEISANALSGQTTTVDWRVGNRQRINLTSNSGSATIAFTAPTGFANLSLLISRTVSGCTMVLPTIKWAEGTPPIFTSTTGAIDIVSLYYSNGVYYGVGMLNLS